MVMTEPPDALGELARQHGLRKVGERPGPIAYLKSLWAARSLLWAMASAKSYNQYQNNYLGQLWTVLSPLTLAVVYYLVFGVLLDTSSGTQNYPAFLTIGIFIFLSMSATLTAGANAILNNMSVVRSVQFPRAVLPLSVSLAEMLNLLPAIGVMYVIVIITGESLSWTWLLIPVVLALILMFTAGVCMIAARIVVAARDLRNLIPMAIRVLRYGSGVFFSVQHYGEKAGPVIGAIMEYQPVALYLNLARSCLMGEVEMTADMWLVGLGWAVLFLVVGYVVFWSAEDQYGRD
ncbi:MAG TPA: ABC transporter permease [Candidatus Avipropionibacterium avicola]|uniref:Transport permease protein n=1 Tax=Candidatus Avipropionibacterium avicola TaxID=2840701 RepID=A0A9D1H137_9ACTN|nr:ABC transporter permease [Candidatus Avipropionibacterium avicola]